jgi:predicted N-acyltransferase
VGAEERADGGADVPLTPAVLRPRTLTGIAAIDASTWDALFPADDPFTRHAFLAALERHGCVGAARGWTPAHVLIEDEGGTLRAAAPAYRKAHSWGEFVFDFAWAEASQRLGRPWYPKRVCAIPYAPVAGPRLGATDAAARAALVAALGAADDLSSAHALFVGEEADAAALAEAGWLERHDLQFHWHDRPGAGFGDFEGFTAALRADKRKKLLRERRRVDEAGVRFAHRRGDALDEAEWREVYALYANTYEERGQPPYLTPGFFLDYGRAPGTPLHLILGHAGGRLVAAAITLIGGRTLYGRHWGAAERWHSLHFETCYHQGIELCLARGLTRYDAGTQGEHKLARGFTPVRTRSLHRIHDARLRGAIEHHLRHERALVHSRLESLASHGPFREEHG